MKIALAQINTTVADFGGNLEKISGFLGRAESQGAELVVFPEQSLAGYPALDLWERPGFIRKNAEALESLARRTRKTAVLVGLTTENKNRSGKPIHNSAALLFKGRVLAVRHKTLLPTYDVFDEARYFEPAAENLPVRFKGLRLGITICEDAWSEERFLGRRLYKTDPIALQALHGADLFINLSASPFIRGKDAERAEILSRHARGRRRAFYYCNRVGADDEIVFDGRSRVLDASGRLRIEAAGFKEDLIVLDTENMPGPIEPGIPDATDEILKALALGIKDYAAKCKIPRVFVGLSGGIDSAVTAALAVQALGAGRVVGVSMPSLYSSQGSRDDAKALAENLGIRLLTIPITPLFNAYREALKGIFAGKPEDATEQNLQARARGTLLMALANKEGGVVLAAGNKSELSAGYCTLYGDMCGGLAPLADVPKGTVYDLARRINQNRDIIPRSSIEKPPSAELKFDQKDQDDLPPYETLDAVLKAHIEGREDSAAIVRRGFAKNLVEDLIRRIDRAEFKRRQAPLAIKVSSKAFGVGRRMPIARGDS